MITLRSSPWGSTDVLRQSRSASENRVETSNERSRGVHATISTVAPVLALPVIGVIEMEKPRHTDEYATE